ncbi:flagellar biosynthesis regulator FlaF [Sulfitobacter sp.]|jgi:flagellar protein FlaF|uniref:flagellar biosynthesis regulator FlaF n=1 Tax=Sulfitobacter sp. TaxID=1903071 RepID=UPI001A0024B5|nr:flaF protein [Sulfitobacter sp.]
MSLAAYKKTIRESDTPRQIERRILSRVTHDLAEKGKDFDASERPADRLAILAGGLRDSLYENQRFWAALRHDLADPENAMPPALKASLISLALWVDRETSGLMAGKGTVAGLVVINTNIVAGLAGQAATAAVQEV